MRRAVALAALACFALVGTSQAQFGNLGRKAKEKAQQAATGQPPQGALKFDNVMLELTPQVIDRVVLGLRARASHQGSGGRSAAGLRTRAQALHDEAEKLNQDRGGERSEFSNKLGNAENCMSEIHSGLRNKHAEDLQRRIMGMTGANLAGDRSANARWMAEYQRIATEMGQAAMAQDSVKGRKLQAEYNKLVGIDPKADSAQARAQCNVPTPPAWMARADSLSEESNRTWAEAREVEAAGNAAGAQASGMTAEQFAMALERIIGYLAANATLKYSAKEQQALSARRAVLEPLVS